MQEISLIALGLHRLPVLLNRERRNGVSGKATWVCEPESSRITEGEWTKWLTETSRGEGDVLNK